MMKFKNVLSVGMIFVAMASMSNVALASTSGTDNTNASSLYFMNGDSGEISPEALTESEINQIIEQAENTRNGNTELAEKLRVLHEPFQKR